MAGLAGFELERCLPDWEIRERFSPGELRVIPDLFALVRVGQGLHAVAIEVDCGTESLTVLGRKAEAYRSLWGQPPGLFGYDKFGIAVVCSTAARRVAVASALKKAWVVPHVFWVVLESPIPALHMLFEELATPLGASPCLKGSGP
jgi:rhodanese-related sulfurtransferase